MATILKYIFLNENVWIPIQIHFLCSKWPHWQLTSLGWDNHVAPKKPQAIIWTSDGLIYWRIYASFGLIDMNRWYSLLTKPRISLIL